MTALNDELRAKAIRAIERRFGQSVMPYRFTITPLGRSRCTDIESGSWIEFRGSGRVIRLKVIAEHDGSAA